MEHSTTIRPLNDLDRSENSVGSGLNLGLDEIDLESLRLVFGSASAEDLKRRKPHELRELWMKQTKRPSLSLKGKKLRMPCFLLDPKNEGHVAPHTVALQLLLGRKSQNDGDGLYKRVSSSEHENQQNSTDGRDNLRTDIESGNSNGRDHEQSVPKNLGTVSHSLLILVAIVALACQFVLEVLGGAGAIWGCAELVRLRKGGASDPSWDLFSWVALGVGICCLVRFFLVHPFFLKVTNPTFAEKHKLRELLEGRRRPGLMVFLQLASVVAGDPVLFLHPTKGHALVGCCGCYCVCCGNQWSSFDPQNSGKDTDDACRSPESIAKSSPQRSTWDLSDDENDESEFVNAL